MRRIPYGAAALVLAVVSPALAASPVSCRIVRDETHDQLNRRGVGHPEDRPEVDVVSGDIASSATHLTTVVRVRALPPGDSQGYGAAYSMLIVGRETYVETYVRVWPDGSTRGRVGTYDVGPSGNTVSSRDLGPAVVVVDRARHEVRATFALSDAEDFLDARKGRLIKVHRAEAMLVFPSVTILGNHASGGAEGADRAEGGSRVYRAGSRSCVRVGS